MKYWSIIHICKKESSSLFVRLSVHMSWNCNFLLTDELILMKFYNLRMCLKEDSHCLKYSSGVISSAALGYFCNFVILLILLVLPWNLWINVFLFFPLCPIMDDICFIWNSERVFLKVKESKTCNYYIILLFVLFLCKSYKKYFCTYIIRWCM